MSTRQLGPFELMERIGAGGMGYVYRAKYVKTGKLVALKILPPGLAWNEKAGQRFARELSILKKLRHANIVRCYGGGTQGKHRYYAMELVEGGSLAKIMKHRGRLSWEQSIDYAVQICKALEHAHANGIVHRDLKPPNLLLTKEGQIKLADFGIALDVDATALTAAGKTVGTFTYMAPEQICGKPPVSHKTDLYALGCVLYRMLTGQAPFDSESTAELLHKHLYQQAPRVTSIALDCPIWLDSLVAQLLDKNPHKRPQDAGAVARALEEVKVKAAQQTGVSKHAASGSPSAFQATQQTAEITKLLGRKKRRKRENLPVYERAWFLAACLLVLLGGMVWALWPASEEQLFARARALMETEEIAIMRDAREPLAAILTRFPEGVRAAEARAYLDEIEVLDTFSQFRARLKNNGAPRSEAEGQFQLAWEYELIDDRLEAHARYQAIEKLFKDKPEARAWIVLAARRAKALEDKAGEISEPLVIIKNQLTNAERAMKDGKPLEAKLIWQSIVKLYDGKAEFATYVAQAQRGLEGKPTRAPETVNGSDEDASNEAATAG